MQRLKDYCGILAWQTGIGYLLLWGVTYWALANGAAVFGQSGVCHADSAQVLSIGPATRPNRSKFSPAWSTSP